MANLIERSMKINPMVSATTFCLTRHASDRLTVTAAGLSHEPGMSCPTTFAATFIVGLTNVEVVLLRAPVPVRLRIACFWCCRF